MSSLREVPVSVRLAQCIGITSAGYLLGQVGTVSALTTPALLEAPAPLLVRQWRKQFDRGRAVGVITSLVPTIAFTFLAYKERSSHNFKLYATAAIAHFLVFPYTRIFVIPINQALFKKGESLAATAIEDTAAEAGISQEETVHGLVDKWAMVALGRAVFALTGIVCGLLASVEKFQVASIDGIALKSGANRLG